VKGYGAVAAVTGFQQYFSFIYKHMKPHKSLLSKESQLNEISRMRQKPSGYTINGIEWSRFHLIRLA
jgi:dsRNA-specific ribonuclease